MTYQLQEWEEWDDPKNMHPPKFCPNCSKPFGELRYISYYVDSHRPSTPNNPFKGVGYDVWCDYCDWTGNIEPDWDSALVERRDQDDNE